MYELIIFDLDGTLMDTGCGVKYSMKETLQELKENNVSEELISRFIGPPILESFQQFLGYNKQKALLGAEIFKKKYQKDGLAKSQVYPHIRETLQHLKERGKILAVVTNKTHENAIKVLDMFELSSYFSHIQGNVPGSDTTKADIIRHCIDTFGIKEENTILIGDAQQDENSAKKASVPFMAVTYGYGFSPKMKKGDIDCTIICHSPMEIANYLL